MPRPRRVVQRRREFVEDLRLIDELAHDAINSPVWTGTAWKLHATFEMLAVRAYTAWETFSHDVLVLTLATDTTRLSQDTGLSIKPKRITFDMAEALLTARGYLEFKDVADLKGKARKWLVTSPFDQMQQPEINAANDLRAIRNFVVHRSRQSEDAYEKLLQTRHAAPGLFPGACLHQGAPPTLVALIAALRVGATKIVP